MAVEWFVLQDNQQQGPITSSHLKLMADQRQITPETLVKQGVSGPWVAAGTIEDLFAVYEHAKPAPTTGSPPVRPSTDFRSAQTQAPAQQAPAAQQPAAAPQPSAGQAPGADARPAPTREAQAPQAPAPQAPAPQAPAPQAPAPQAEDPNVQWFVQAPNGQQYGPAVKAQLDAWVQEGRVIDTCLLWRAGWDQWRWAGTVYPHLARAASAAAPTAAHAQPAPRTDVPSHAPTAAHMQPVPRTDVPSHAPAGAAAPAPGATPAPAARAAPQAVAQPAAGADPLIGQMIGRFEVRELIGRGSSGAVYKARQPALDRLVAVRVLPAVHDAQLVERLRRELRAAAALNHPNIVEIHDMGEDRGRAFVAMELVEGGSLADLVRRHGRVPVSRGLEIMKQVAAALAMAHAAGVVHRDVKPSNILLSPKGLAKLGDFGLALRSGVNLAATTGPAPASALYMAPEAARGQVPDARSDLYSFGATFYHAFSGRPPLEGPTGAEVLRRHLETPPAPLVQAAPNSPPSLARVIDRLLAKDPAARYQTAGELLAALNQVAVPQAVAPLVPAAQAAPQAPAPGAAAQAQVPQSATTRPPWLVLAAAAVAGAALVLGAAWLVSWLFLRGPAERDPSDEPAAPPPAAAPAPPVE